MKKTPAQQLADSINSALGADTVKLGSDKALEVTYTTTGLLPFDILLNGGMPRGRFVEVSGDYSTLKSYLGLYAIMQYQQLGGTAALIDTEKVYDPDWARNIGVDVDNLIIWPNRGDDKLHTGEEAIDAAQALVSAGVDFIVFDSVAAAFPQDESKKRMLGESLQPARLAMLMSRAMRLLTASNSHTAILWINQTRMNIGITFGPQETPTGGKALGFYASYRISIRKGPKITKPVRKWTGEKWENRKQVVGQQFRAELIKSKLSKPYGEVWFTWDMVDDQIDMVSFLIAECVDLGLVTQRGNTWYYGDGVRAVGKDKFKERVAGDPNLMREMEAQVRNHHGLPSISRGSRARGKKRVTRLRS